MKNLKIVILSMLSLLIASCGAGDNDNTIIATGNMTV